MNKLQKHKNMEQLTCLLLCLLFSLSTCKKEEEMVDILSIKKEPYTGTQLRTDGYYYNEYTPGYLTVYFFYRDGILLYGSSFPINELDRHETMYRNGEHYNFSKGLKDSWGVFKIDGNKILFERWYPSQPPLKAFVGSGIILNDTTFRITEYYRMQGGQKTNVESSSEIYHFKAFSPKPDSTNNFVK